MSDQLKFPKFSTIPVSTKTYTAMTNLTINIRELYEFLPITPYTVIPKKRGRKKKGSKCNPNKNVQPGSIITIKCEGEMRGVELNPKKKKAKKWFRNSITVVIIIDKPINFKVCRNGTFQMTGCKHHNHAEQCVKYLWNYIKDSPHLFTFTRLEPNLEVLFIPSMRNIDFSLGFLVDRSKLNKYMSHQDKFHCLLETSFGYTGVNIKIPLKEDLEKMKIKKLIFSQNEWTEKQTIYQEYLDLLGKKERKAKLSNKRYNTFLVFHSGSCIMSGLTREFMEPVYEYFINLIRKGYDEIEERLDTTSQGLSLEEELAVMLG
tara:strand:- start:770 stop:1723 length:954 start_codon:yes stop_codon:yes gene_type:complete